MLRLTNGVQKFPRAGFELGFLSSPTIFGICFRKSGFEEAAITSSSPYTESSTPTYSPASRSVRDERTNFVLPSSKIISKPRSVGDGNRDSLSISFSFSGSLIQGTLTRLSTFERASAALGSSPSTPPSLISEECCFQLTDFRKSVCLAIGRWR